MRLQGSARLGGVGWSREASADIAYLCSMWSSTFQQADLSFLKRWCGRDPQISKGGRVQKHMHFSSLLLSHWPNGQAQRQGEGYYQKLSIPRSMNKLGAIATRIDNIHIEETMGQFLSPSFPVSASSHRVVWGIKIN